MVLVREKGCWCVRWCCRFKNIERGKERCKERRTKKVKWCRKKTRENNLGGALHTESVTMTALTYSLEKTSNNCYWPSFRVGVFIPIVYMLEDINRHLIDHNIFNLSNC